MAKSKPASARDSASATDFSTLYPQRADESPEDLEPVIVHNQSAGELHHDTFRLRPGETLEVPSFIAEIWMGVTHLGRPRVILASDMLKGVKTISAAEALRLKEENDTLAAAKGEDNAKIANLEKLVKQLQGQIADPGKKDVKSSSPGEGGGE